MTTENNCVNQLLRYLQEKGQVVPVSDKFRLLNNNVDRVNLLYDLFTESHLFPVFIADEKSETKYQDYYLEAQDTSFVNSPQKAIELYTKSIACAPNDSTLLNIALANRATILNDYKLFKECLADLNAKHCFPKNLQPAIAKVRAIAKKSHRAQWSLNYLTEIPTITEKNPLIQCASSSIAIEKSPKEGRYVVATQDIGPGDIIAIEKPLFKILTDQSDIHCHHCLKLCYNLSPCPNCTQFLFCSESCQQESSKYHQYECPILLTLTNHLTTLEILSLRIAISVRDEYKNHEWDLVEGDQYRSDRYRELHNLVGNTDKRTVGDLFNKSAITAIGFYLLKTHTDFFKNENTEFEDTFKEIMLRHRQIGPCNFHEIIEHKLRNKSLENTDIGAGAYPFLSIFNHSCYPNTTRYSYGPIAVVIAIETIKKGEKCSDNYGYHHAVMEKSERQQKLKKDYLFDCECEACLKDFPFYQNLPKISQIEHIVSLETFKLLEQGNIKEARRMYIKTIGDIKKFEKSKPNKDLSEFQEVLKQCCFIFKSIETPI